MAVWYNGITLSDQRSDGSDYPVGWFAMRDAGSNPATVAFYRRSPIGRDNGLKIRPVWVRVPSAVFVPVA